MEDCLKNLQESSYEQFSTRITLDNVLTIIDFNFDSSNHPGIFLLHSISYQYLREFAGRVL